MGIITVKNNIYFFFYCMIFLGCAAAFAQCPTVTNPTQSFCDVQSPTVSSLAANNTGGGVVWYATPTSTTPLSPAAGLVNGATYYVDSSSGGCSPRPSVTISIFSAPTGQNFQGVCVDEPSGATISDLIAVGNNVQWYLTPTGGTSLPGSTQLIDDTIYYASQTNPNTGCETSRLSVFVNVGVVPVPSGSAVQQFCNTPGNPPIVANLDVSGNNRWYLTSTSAVPLPLNTPLINGQSYFATTVDPPCESASRFEVQVVLVEPNNAGTNGSLSVCQNQLTTTTNLYTLLGGNPNTTGVWTGPRATTNGFQGTLDLSTLTLAGSPYVFTYTVSSALCPTATATATITVLPLPVATISGTTTICSGNSATITFTGTPNGVATYTVNNGPNQTITLNSAGTASITSVLTATTTYTLVSVSSSGTTSCTQVQSGSVVITVLPLPTATIASSVSVCSGGSATVTFTGTPNATVVYTVNSGANQNIVLNSSGTATITGTFTVTTTYTLVSISSAGSPICSRPLTGSVVITVIPLPIVTISGNVSICPNQSATVTFTGTPGAAVTYTVNGSVPQTINLNSSGTATLIANYAVTTVFTLVSVSTQGLPACSQLQSGSVTITVLPLPVATISQSTTICSGASATVTFTGTPNANIVYTVNSGPNQTIQLNGSGVATITNTYTATTTFTLVSATSTGTPSCTQSLAGSITITVAPLPTVTIGSNVTICPNNTATITFTGTANAVVTYTVNSGAAQTISLNSSGNAAIVQTYASTTVYTLVSVATTGSPACVVNATGSATITVLPLPVVSISATPLICSGGSATVTFTGTPGAIVVYTINNGPNQSILLNASGTASITSTYTVNTIFTLISISSGGTPSCPQTISGSAQITVQPLPTATISSPVSICSGASATITFTGTPNAVITYSTGGPNATITLNASGTATVTANYTATTTFTLISASTGGTPACSQPLSGTVTITVVPLPVVTLSPPQSICTGNSATVTFTGTPNATVIYTVNNGPQLSIVLNASGTATITSTYTATTVYTLVSVTSAGTPGCTSLVTNSTSITVIPLPIVTISGGGSICPNGSATVTFTGTPNAVVTYTINNGPQQTITLNGAGTAAITNTYTATTTFTVISAATVPNNCNQLQPGSVIITVVPLPTATISASTTICAGASATVTFTGTANTNVTYTVNGATQSILIGPSGVATITASYAATTVFTLVSASSTEALNCTQPLTGSITITVLPLPIVTISADATVCPGGFATITFTGTPNATVTYSVNGTLLNIVLNASGSAVVGGTFFTTTVYELENIVVSGVSGCTQEVSGTVTITVIPFPTVAISADASTICSGTSATITFTGTPNATVIYAINNGPQQNIILGPDGTATISNAFVATATYTLVSAATAGSPSCSQPQTGSVTITAIPAPVAGNDVFDYTICANGAPVNLFSLLGTDAQPGGSWSPSLASGSGIFNPAVDAAGTYVYTLTGNAPCPEDTASVTVTIIAPPNAGQDSTTQICSNEDAEDLFLLLGSNAQSGGTWSPALASGTGFFDPAVDVAGTYTYTVSPNNSTCGSDSSVVTVSLIPGPDAGQNGALTLCVNSLPQNLFNYLNGTPQQGGTWSPALASGTGVFNPAVDQPGVYTYTFFGNQPCDNDTATITVTVNPVPNAGVDANVPFCTNYAPTDLFTFLTGNPQTGGTWSPALASGTGVFNPLVDPSGTYTYSVGGNLCATDTATVTITVFQSPNAGGPGSTLTTCVTTTQIDLTTGLNGTQSLGIWTDNNGTGALNGNIFNPSAVLPGTYQFTYTVTGGISPCLLDTATVTVVVDPISNAGTFTPAAPVCASAGTFDLSTLLVNSQAGGIWTDANNAPVPSLLPISGLAGGAYSFTYTIVNSCGTDSEVVQLSILSTPILTIPNITLMTPVCLGQNAVVVINGIPDGSYVITYNLSGANTVANQSVFVAIASGTGSFSIPTASLVNIGTTTITFVSIANTVTNCIATLSNVQVNVVVNPLSNLEPSNISVANVCAGTSVVVSIANATTLPNGNYQFTYSIPNAVPSTGTSGIVNIVNGAGTFTIPSTFFPQPGIFTLTISGITSLAGGCSNASENVTATFEVYPLLSFNNAIVTAGEVCLGNSNEVFISNVQNLPDSIYTIIYVLSGANTGTETISVSFTNGAGSFVLPASLLTNTGSVTVSFQFVSIANVCGTGGSNGSVTFNVVPIGSPVTINEENAFCDTDIATVADLFSSSIGQQPVIWTDALNGGTAYQSTDPLVNGTVYYTTIASSGCQSVLQIAITVAITNCNDIIIPDGFSPNGDSINDTFTIVDIREIYPNFKLEIFNRYGNVLYKGNANSPDWDGTAREGGVTVGNETAPVGVYFYVLDFNDGSRNPIQGRVYLSR